MRKTERKLKRLAKALPKSKTVVFSEIKEEKSTSPLFFKLTVPVMAVIVCFSLTIAVSAEMREAVLGLFRSTPVGSEQGSSEEPVSSDEASHGPKPFYTAEELDLNTATQSKDGVEEFLKVFRAKQENDPEFYPDFSLSEEEWFCVTPTNISQRSDCEIFVYKPTSFNSNYFLMVDNDIFHFCTGKLNSSLVCDINGDGYIELVSSIYQQNSGLQSVRVLHVFDTKDMKKSWISIGDYEQFSPVLLSVTYASEEATSNGIYFYVTTCYPFGEHHNLYYYPIGDLRLNDEGELYFHEYTEEELAEINSRE